MYRCNKQIIPLFRLYTLYKNQAYLMYMYIRVEVMATAGVRANPNPNPLRVTYVLVEDLPFDVTLLH